MRTTLTLDEDVAARLKAESRRSGQSFKETVNECLRLGLRARQQPKPAKPFKIRDIGLRIGGEYTAKELMERWDGPFHK